MSATVVVEVPISQAIYERIKQRAAQENRSITDLLEESVQDSEERREAFRRMGEAIERMQAQSVISGTSNMTMDEINEEIAAMHREQAELQKSV